MTKKKKSYDDGYRRRPVSKQLAPGFVPPKNLLTAKEVAWSDKAACKGMDVSLFFPENGQNIPPEVRQICIECPVRNECYIYAEKNYIDDHGLFGGYTPKQRSERRRVTGRTSPEFKQQHQMAA